MFGLVRANTSKYSFKHVHLLLMCIVRQSPSYGVYTQIEHLWMPPGPSYSLLLLTVYIVKSKDALVQTVLVVIVVIGMLGYWPLEARPGGRRCCLPTVYVTFLQVL